GGMGGVAVSKFGGWLFDFYNAQNAIHTGYAIMFAFCALAYVIAWCVMKTLVPTYRPVIAGHI
ncbi:MAG TPA: MFS transporter, partial [Cellvibrionaceae bacterium]|nr:MFS transporter [Cellvibrionaceae bacterium]